MLSTTRHVHHRLLYCYTDFTHDQGDGKDLQPQSKRSMQDYFKRVALRLGAQARERKEAEGGAGGLGLASDEVEDEREVWSVGRVDLDGGGVGGGGE